MTNWFSKYTTLFVYVGFFFQLTVSLQAAKHKICEGICAFNMLSFYVPTKQNLTRVNISVCVHEFNIYILNLGQIWIVFDNIRNLMCGPHIENGIEIWSANCS